MREKSYEESLEKHFSFLMFILENGNPDERAAVLGSIWATADNIQRCTGQRIPKITFKQIEKFNISPLTAEAFQLFDIDLNTLRN